MIVKTEFNGIYERYWLALYRLAFKIMGNEAVAKDVVQDVFVSLWERSCRVKIHKPEAYLFQAVKKQCFMVLRAGAISKKHLERLNAIILHSPIPDSYDFRELQGVLEDGMASLPHRCREVFRLSRNDSLSNREIAERLNISHKTVENHITKALRVLRHAMDKMAVLFF